MGLASRQRPLLLDLFCGAGGASVGYHRAGFDVIGVDHVAQPRYPFEFIQGDAAEFLTRLWCEPEYMHDIVAIHTSPPCQAYSTTRTLHSAEYPELIEDVRSAVQRMELPYIIENVQGAPLLAPVRLCGSSLGLGVRRHRLFETPVPVLAPPCDHASQRHPIDVTGGGPSKKLRMDGAGGRSRKPRNMAEASEAMGIDWMTRAELNEAVPPVYTELIGGWLLQYLNRSEVDVAGKQWYPSPEAFIAHAALAKLEADPQ